MSLKALSGYSGLSVRTLRTLLKDPDHPLPCYRIGGKVLVRRSEYDTWAARYRQVGNADLNRVVAAVVRDVRTGKPPRARKVHRPVDTVIRPGVCMFHAKATETEQAG
jgi:lambda repressor-like predicted transcriptional regulator